MNRLTDAEKLAHIVELVADEMDLEAHYARHSWDTQLPQAAAFSKLRRFLESDLADFRAHRKSPTISR